MKIKKLLNAVLVTAITVLMIGSCTKKSDNKSSPASPIKYYSVKLEFISSNSSAADFVIHYNDENGNGHDVTNGSSGWTKTFVAKTGTLMYLSVQSITTGANVNAVIYTDNNLFKSDIKNGNGALVSATASGTLP